MKNVIFVLVFLISFSELHSQSKEFTIGYTGCYPIDGDLSVTSATNWNWYNELNVNLWQGWGIGEVSKHGFVFDSLHNHNLKGYFQPDSMMQHALGKVNIHQAESNTQSSFRYNYHSNFGSDVTETFMGETVTSRFFDAANYPIGEAGNPVTVLSNLNENRVQIYSGLVLDPKMQWFWDEPTGQHKNSWYVKPRMRISTSDAFGSVKNVVKIIVRAYNSSVVKSVTLLTSDFRYLNNNTYDGRYLEEYPDNIINISADSINRGFPTGSKAWMDTSKAADSNHVDFEIQWFGEVNVWIDYVKIMDEPAYKLFNPNFDDRDRIKGQIQKMMNRQNGNTIRGFFIEEIEYSNLTCLQFLQDSILPQVISDPYIKINCLINPWSYQHNVKSKDSLRYEEYLDKVKPPELFFVMYPIGGPEGNFRALIPNNITSFYVPPDYPSNVRQKLDSFFAAFPNYKTSLTVYNDTIQYIWNRYEDILQFFRRKTLLRNMNFITVAQILHEHLSDVHPIFREPMNSEISAQYYIALCRGTTGIFVYPYLSFYKPPGSPRIPGGYGGRSGLVTEDIASTTAEYVFGMTEFTGTSYWGSRKRETNFYHEPKWNFVKSLNEKLKASGNIFANSNNTQGYSVNAEGANHNFILDIKSLKRNPSYSYTDDPICTYCDATNERYWEIGFFYPDYLVANDKSKYFMMVNKRCVPEINSDGDLRFLQIKFNSSQLSGFNNWNITDVFSNTVIRTFDKDSNIFLNIAEFQPGEGKLYKLSPVMQEGGTLVADEEVSNVQFVCKSTVMNNDKNITIGSGTEIFFKEGAGINMTGGNFICSNSNLSGSDTSIWNGIFLRNTGIDSIVYCTFSDAKTSVMILNDTGYFFTSRVINNNVFNVPSGSGNNGIYGENNFRITIQDNTFNMPDNPADRHIGVYLKNNNTTGVENLPEENEPAPNFRMFLIHNTFNNGTVSAMLINYTSSYLPFYVKSNTLNSACAYGIVGRNMTGSIKDNIISYSGALIPMGIHLVSSSPDLYNNVINTENVSLHTVYSSFQPPSESPSSSGLRR